MSKAYPDVILDPVTGKPKHHTDVIRDPETGVTRTRGCPLCDGTSVIGGEDCPRCFDPARYDHPEDGIPHVCPDGEIIHAVARVEDVPQVIIRFYASDNNR